MSKFKELCRLLPLMAGCAVFVAGIQGVGAQGAPPGGAPTGGPPPGAGAPPAGGFRLPSLPKRGFEATGQSPKDYTPLERQAVQVVEKWMQTINSHDTDGHMALIDDDIVFRGDPTSPLSHGAAQYCGTIVGLGPNNVGATFILNELYVVGGKSDVTVLLKRTDINGGAGSIGFLGGYPVPVSSMLRIRNGKVVEWLDAPTNRISISGLPFVMPSGPGPRVPPWCAKFSNGSKSLTASNAAPAQGLNYHYGTEKPEYFFNPFEEAAAQAVRGWFGAWQSGDPLLLAAFVDQNVIFRGSPTDDLGHGRDSLLQQVCGSVGGKRKLTELFVVGGDYDTSVLTRWDDISDPSHVTHRGSYFRVRNGLIVEWYDAPNDTARTARTSAAGSSRACQSVQAALNPPAGR